MHQDQKGLNVDKSKRDYGYGLALAKAQTLCRAHTVGLAPFRE